MRISSATLILVLTATVQSIVVPRPHVLHEKREDTLSNQWIKRDKLSPSATLPMRIGLTQQNLENGYDLLMDVSHPDSKKYGKHWTPEEVISKFAPSQKTVQSVQNWLTEFGIDAERLTHSDNRGWIAFDATVEEADSLLAAEFHNFEHEESGALVPACDSYHVPKHIQTHVDYITPGVKLLAPFGAQNQMSKRGFGIDTSGKPLPPPMVAVPNSGFPLTAAGPLATCDQWISPDCVRALYNVSATPEYPNGVPRADNSMGIFESGDFYSQTDLNVFFKNFTPSIPQNTAPTPAFIDGATAPLVGQEGVGGESGLDFMLAYPLLYPQKITLYQTDDYYYTTYRNTGATGAFNTFLDAIDGSYCTYSAYGETGNAPFDPVYPNPVDVPGAYKGQLMCGVYKPTNVLSISYGGQEATLPASYQMRQCNEYLKLGLQGISIFFASGDSGVAGTAYSTGAGANGCLGKNYTVFNPTWPSNCPYVTNVGATKIYPNHTVFEPESAVVDPLGHPYGSAFSSGGGFSNLYQVPDYQKNAVDAYFKSYTPSYPSYIGNSSLDAGEGLYNRLGRGIPDVSAVGDNIATFFEGRLSRSGGTSASTPVFASLVNRINEQRLNAGKSTLGFMNPALYLHPEILNDITNGTNPGCGTVGFSAVPGWDPVTGLGTPNYPKMLAYFMSLP